jgi:hypothetical protein
MEEPEVVKCVKNYLKREGWIVQNTIQAGHLQDEQYIPDILAIKQGKILVAEAKGSVSLATIITGVGQCIADTLYGGNIVCYAVPEDIAFKARSLIKNIVIGNGGRIGLFVVKKNGEVILDPSWKELKLTKSLQNLGRSRLTKLTFVRDLKIYELGEILKIAFDYRTKYTNQQELAKILVSKKNIAFKNRTSISKKSAINALITVVNLGLIDSNSQLTSDGLGLRNLFIEDKEKYKDQLAFLLLTKGNWLVLLQVLEELKPIIISKPKLFTRYTNLVVDKLIEIGILEKEIAREDMARKIRSNHIRWLIDLEIITKWDNKTKQVEINWSKVCRILRSGLYYE